MRFFTTVVTLLALVTSTVWALSEGTYIIVNRVLSPDGEELAITFNGKDHAATLTPNTKCKAHQWVLKKGDRECMSVTPVTATDLQAAWGADYVTVLPAGDYVWSITSTMTGYNIQDCGKTVSWGTACASTGQNVTIGPCTTDEKQRWIFHKVE